MVYRPGGNRFFPSPEQSEGSRSVQETGCFASRRKTVRVKSLVVCEGDQEAGLTPDGEEGIGQAGAFHPAAEIFSILPEHKFSRYPHQLSTLGSGAILSWHAASW